MKNTSIPFHGLFTSVADWMTERFIVFTNVRFDPLIFLRELASMLRSGIPLHQALDFSANSFGPIVRTRLNAVKQRVEDGEPLSLALQALPKRWASATIIATIEAGEKAGRLPDMLEGLSNEFELLASLDRRLRATLIYPLFVLLIGALCIHVVIWKVVPVFANIYESLHGILPWGLRLLVNFWNMFGGLTIIVLLVLLAFHIITLNRPSGLSQTSMNARIFWWNLPIIRGLRAALIEVRFARTLRLLLDSGAGLPEGLDICEKVVGDNRAGVAIVRSARKIRDGEKPSQILKGLAFLSPAFIWFIANSEQRGDFVELTQTMAEAAEERFATRLEVLEGFLEPASTLALGIVVGGSVIAIYQTMFNLIPMIGD